MPARIEYMSDEQLLRDYERTKSRYSSGGGYGSHDASPENERARLQQAKKYLDQVYKKRSIEPQDYDTPTKAQDLNNKYKFGGLYFRHTQITGEDINFKLEHANLSGAIFKDCNFSGCSLKSAQLIDARFDNCTFDNADLNGADLERARFSGCTGLALDDNFIRGATFGPRPGDKWHRLKGTYAGHGQAFHILFSILYFGPIILKISFLLALATFQDRAQLAKRAELITLSPKPIYKLIYNENGLLWYLTIGVLVYQALRILLTYRIGPLADRESATGYSPNKSEYSRYWRAHQVVRTFGIAAIIALSIHSWVILTSQVWLPVD